MPGSPAGYARQSWIEATRDIATELLSGTEPVTVFRACRRGGAQATAADAALVAVPVDEDMPVADVGSWVGGQNKWQRCGLPQANDSGGGACCGRSLATRYLRDGSTGRFGRL